jgi:5-methylcytosine-specific restriction endonuclease McrA
LEHPLAGIPADLKAFMPKVSLRTPVRPPLRLPVTVVPVQDNREPYVRISNPEGARFTSRRRALKFVARGWAVWSGNAIRFITEDRGTPRKARAEFRATQIETCAATVARRRELERAELERSATGSHTQAEWEAILSLYGGRCLRCGAKGVKLTKDHVIPLSEGGSHSASNLQPLCGPCNSSKGARIIDFRVRASA